MGDNTNPTTQSIADYLAQLLKDKKQLAAFPNVFLHVERLLDEEIGRVRSSLFQINGTKKEPLVLPDAQGALLSMSEKVYVPVKEHPDFNFVGRILGPRGMTAKQLEQETGCKIMVRGRGSMRDKKKEEMNRGKPNWEHLNDELHVLITVEDTENRARVKLQRAVDEVKKLLIPADGEDELKKRQLMELAIINGTYRDSSMKGIPAGWAVPNEANEKSHHWTLVLPSEAEQMCTHPFKYAGWPDSQDENSDSYQLAKFAHTLASANYQTDGPRLLTPTLQSLGAQLRNSAAATGSTPLGAPLILSPRLPVPTTVTSSALLNGSGPPPLITPGDAGLLYAPYAAEYNYAIASPLLTEYADHAGAAAKQRRHLGQLREHPYQRAGALS